MTKANDKLRALVQSKLQAYNGMTAVQREMRTHDVPTRRQTKIAQKRTKGTRLSLNHTSLTQCPGNARAGVGRNIAIQSYAAETGCAVKRDDSNLTTAIKHKTGGNTTTQGALLRPSTSPTKEQYLERNNGAVTGRS